MAVAIFVLPVPAATFLLVPTHAKQHALRPVSGHPGLTIQWSKLPPIKSPWILIIETIFQHQACQKAQVFPPPTPEAQPSLKAERQRPPQKNAHHRPPVVLRLRWSLSAWRRKGVLASTKLPGPAVSPWTRGWRVDSSGWKVLDFRGRAEAHPEDNIIFPLPSDLPQTFLRKKEKHWKL